MVLDDQNQVILPDIKDSTGRYFFSDGVGIMKRDVARKVVRKLGLNPNHGIPSAFQVRFGGAKGMLTVWDEAFPQDVDPSVRVILRESMNKFSCSHNAIEVVGFSKRIALFLNRQIIALLSGHGVPDSKFLMLQGKVLRSLDRAMEADGGRHAIRLLRGGGTNLDDGRGMRLFSSGPGVRPDEFFRAGLSCISCKHLFNIMYAFRRRTIGDLIKKARIPIDDKKGLCVIGVVDELGVLGPREIFCQYKHVTTEKPKVVTGPVTVGRSPCLHPGDIQPLTAVDVPQLRHLVDVIVFPRVGRRPIPSMLCGGDLDGDIYFCIFDEAIELPNRSEINAMNYTSPQPVELPGPVRSDDVADFFVDYIKNYNVGKIANAHVVSADKEPTGIFSSACLDLAMHHSTAVDFPKTGIQVPYLGPLLPRQAPNSYPDFMGKHAKVSYASSRVLGKLHRACIAHTSRNAESMDYTFKENQESRKIDAIFEDIANSEQMTSEATYMCLMYNAEISILMQQYGVHSEGEIVSGNVISFPDGLSSKKAGQNHFTLQMRLNRQVDDIRCKFREEFFADIEPWDEARKKLKASTWYMACRRVALKDMASDPDTVLVSFPWVVADVLLPIIKHELHAKEN